MVPNLKYGQNIFFAPDSVRWPSEDMFAWTLNNATAHRITLAPGEQKEMTLDDATTTEFFGQRVMVAAAKGSSFTLHLTHRGTHTTSITTFDFVIDEGATVNCTETFASDENYHRLRLNVELQGEQAAFTHHLSGTFTNDNRLDAETIVAHQAPRTTSALHNRVVLNDNAKAIVRDTSVVPKGMIDCACSQDSRALLLSRTTEADMIPVLDINTDQVTASHAASISRPSRDNLFFLESRGVSRDDARELAVQGFLSYGK
jgi:Fe-S cluster assembly scaffold protein SufB